MPQVTAAFQFRPAAALSSTQFAPTFFTIRLTAGGFNAVIAGENKVPALGGGLGSPGYGLRAAFETVVCGRTVVLLPDSKMAAYTLVPSLARARGSSPSMARGEQI